MLNPPWLVSHLEEFDQLMVKKKMPHALIISANEGWGEDLLAEQLSLRLLGQSLDQNIANLAHPDLCIVLPDGAETKLDSVREAIKFSYLTPQLAESKVVLLKEAHCLNSSAANALLKTLEEPPPATFLILSSCQSEKLLPTIRSRCQRFHVKPDHEIARKWLEKNGILDALQSAREGGIGPLITFKEFESGNPSVHQVLEDIWDTKAPLSFLDLFLEMEPRTLTNYWYRYLVDMVARFVTQDARSSSAIDAILNFEKELLWVRKQLLDSNSANSRLLIGRLISKWYEIGGLLERSKKDNSQ